MTKRKYHIGYYVAIQELTGLHRVKLWIGPFETRRAAWLMEAPARRTINRDRFNVITHAHKISVDRKLPPGQCDLSLLNLADVITASRRL